MQAIYTVFDFGRALSNDPFEEFSYDRAGDSGLVSDYHRVNDLKLLHEQGGHERRAGADGATAVHGR